MGIKATLSNFKSFTFNGVNSRTYGVYITGKGVYNAPERNVEMVEIPGRNGSYALDKGNFNNIEVTYEAAIFADTQADYADAMSDLRNFLCSQTGYVRLEDDYNPNEYRLAVYKSGLETDPFLSKMGKFELVFDCKPQRFLTSGETALDILQDPVLTNPTLFDAHPFIEAVGYGRIVVGTPDVVIENIPIGEISVADRTTVRSVASNPVGIGQSLWHTGYLNSNDVIMCNGETLSVDIVDPHLDVTNPQITSQSNVASAKFTKTSRSSVQLAVTIADRTFYKGVNSTQTSTVAISFKVGGTTYTNTLTITISYSGSNISHSYTWSTADGLTYYMVQTAPEIFAISTQPILGNTIYIDLELGEAWMGTVRPISLNKAVIMPTELPTLKSGVTSIGYDNTLTTLKFTPRWWTV